MACSLAWSQPELKTQSDLLHLYAGEWESTSSPNTQERDKQPLIKMSNHGKMDDRSVTVDVSMYRGKEYVPILTELISYDSKSEQIIAFGQNEEGTSFLGKGQFSSDRRWSMKDVDFLGNAYLQVEFEFLSNTDVVLEGFDNDGNSLWKTRYVKTNPKDKNIGIQLVSVNEDMQRNPIRTLGELGRMGYSYVETFVYSKGTFYGMTPSEFKKAVEAAGMSFLGSMTFHDLPSPESWERSMEWWETCIDDHLEAGVQYLTTSNNQLKNVQSIAMLQAYCNYYNAIGKLCEKKGISFAYHNHADEFNTVEGVRIYDYFLKNTDPRYVSFQADIYWMDVGKVDPVEYFRKHPNRFLSWHVKDYKELGLSGKIDWDKIFNEHTYPLPHYIVAEVEDYSYPPLYSVQLAWEYLYFDLLN